MMSKLKIVLAAGLIAGALDLGAVPASALPVASGVAPAAGASAMVDKVYYRCGYYGCRRHYGYRGYYRAYRPYRYYGYGYRRPYIGFGFY